MTKGKLEKQIRAVLAEDEKSRNSDIRLTQLVWWKYHNGSFKMIDGIPYVNANDLAKLPREDNIKRIRAKIQNDLHEFLPTDPKIAEKRGWQIEEWRSYLGYENKPDYL